MATAMLASLLSPIYTLDTLGEQQKFCEVEIVCENFEPL